MWEDPHSLNLCHSRVNCICLSDSLSQTLKTNVFNHVCYISVLKTLGPGSSLPGLRWTMWRSAASACGLSEGKTLNFVFLPCSISDQKDARDRMVQVVKWYLSAFHAGRKGSVAKKPYNPILGEIFQCHWTLPNDTEENAVSSALVFLVILNFILIQDFILFGSR